MFKIKLNYFNNIANFLILVGFFFSSVTKNRIFSINKKSYLHHYKLIKHINLQDKGSRSFSIDNQFCQFCATGTWKHKKKLSYENRLVNSPSTWDVRYLIFFSHLDGYRNDKILYKQSQLRSRKCFPFSGFHLI